MESHDESEAKQESFAGIDRCLHGQPTVAWMKALKKDPIHKNIMATRDDYVNNDMFDPDKAMAAAVDNRKFLLKRLLEDQGRFSRSDDDQLIDVLFI